MAYVYIKSEPQLWTVGFYDPKGEWHPDSDHDNREEAADRVAYLNGGMANWKCDHNCELKRSLSEALNSGDGVYRP